MSEFRATAPSAPAVFYRSYSRRKEDGTRENFEEAITRTISAIADIGNFTDEQRNLALTTGLGQYCFPSGRSLWVAGTDWSKKPENYPGYYNCCSMHVEEVATFGLLMELAMMGTGTGAVLEKDVIDKLPAIQRSLNIKTVKTNKGLEGGAADTEIKLTGIKDGKPTILVRVGDSRQGWAAAYQGLIELAMGQPAAGEVDTPQYADATIVLDLSQVRQAGELLKGFGGTANPVRLQETMERVCAVLSKAVGRKMTATEVCLLIDEAASAVVAGNIRRSAGMRQFSSDDFEAAESKEGLYKQDEDGNWAVDPEKEALRMANHTRCYHTKPSLAEIKDAVTKQYWSGEGAIQYVPESIARANADLLNDAAKKKFFLNIYTSGNKTAAQEYLKTLAISAGEPADDRILSHRMERYGLNPCGEILLRDNLCNLSEVHLNTISPTDTKTQENAFYAGGLQVAALLQHEFVPERLAYSRKNDPIVGVSFTGLFDFFVHAFGAEWLAWMMDGRPGGRLMRKFSELERRFLIKWRLAAERGVADYCKQAGIRMPNRCTTVQPAGSKSLLTGASPGWHPPKAQRFIRRITFGVHDPLVSALRDYGYSVIPAQSARDDEGNLLDDINDPRVQEVLVEIPTEVSWANMPGCDEFDLSQLSVEAQWGLYMQVQTFYTTHNCFSRDTRFLTDEGVKSFEDYEVGDTVTVLNLDGDWVPASVVNTGDERPMLKITLREGKTGNEKVITSTYCHRFPVKRISGGNTSAKIVQAKDLKVGHRFVTNTPDLPDLDEDGIRHGIVFGDGSLYREKWGEFKGAQLYLCGAKRQLQPYFTDFDRTHERDDIDQTRIYGLPTDWKSLPSSDCTQSYLAGFIAGLLATDGSICNSTITISTSNKKVVDFIVDQAPRIGVRVGGFTFSEQSGYPNSVGNFGLRLIKATFPENMILRPHHLEHFNSRDTQPCQWKVVAIEPTDPQLGWCVMEPKTSHFTLSDNILVMNTSATLEFREDEIDLLSRLIYENIRIDGGYISAALLARFDANETFPRLPFEPIDKATYDRRMAAVMAARSVLPEDVTMLDLLKQYDNKDYELKGAAGCDSAKCLLDAGKDTDQVGKLT
jgi:ribonucleotide reductase class II